MTFYKIAMVSLLDCMHIPCSDKLEINVGKKITIDARYWFELQIVRMAAILCAVRCILKMKNIDSSKNRLIEIHLPGLNKMSDTEVIQEEVQYVIVLSHNQRIFEAILFAQ